MRLNLASRPFRNERLPNLLAVVGLAAALGVSAWHLFVARDVLPDRTSSLVHTLGERESESARLREEEASLRALRPEAASIAEWKRVKDLVDQRVFSWSALFAVLQETFPDGVRLRSLAPEAKDGNMSLTIQINARTHEEALDLLTRMEDRPEFEGVQPTTRSTVDDGSIDLACVVQRYLPQLPPAAPPPAKPAADAPAAEQEPAPSTQAMR